MPFTMKIQPIDSHVPEEVIRVEPVKPVVKSRLKRLFERQFSGVLRNSSAEKIAGEEPHSGVADFEPSSVCLAKMVQNFIEENHEKHSVYVKCARNRYNSFDDSYDGETHSESNYSSSAEAHEILKVNIVCVFNFLSIVERLKLFCNLIRFYCDI